MKETHKNNGNRKKKKPGPRKLIIVVIKLIAPAIDAAPAKCKLKIATSTAVPECPIASAKGGYKVHPVPTPTSAKLDKISNSKDGGNNQKLKLFNLGKAISAVPNNNGIKKLPNPPISIGITIKKIMIKACDVTIVL